MKAPIYLPKCPDCDGYGWTYKIRFDADSQYRGIERKPCPNQAHWPERETQERTDDGHVRRK